ncbi:conserved protein of unknown function [Pseudomonas putida KT2440]|uniref:Uncharacterized protein n=1 Tax=Pseudomonas putida (strain ATCC 47054 / DSM 6125 / CFBP 8728 / NCIMB 11950 / KT2440) TaxID=160488 RepID=Q88GE4_PSEPK|nr:conserved protein of unknown function [Pseudomonas putida KT2440]
MLIYEQVFLGLLFVAWARIAGSVGSHLGGPLLHHLHGHGATCDQPGTMGQL